MCNILYKWLDIASDNVLGKRSLTWRQETKVCSDRCRKRLLDAMSNEAKNLAVSRLLKRGFMIYHFQKYTADKGTLHIRKPWCPFIIIWSPGGYFYVWFTIYKYALSPVPKLRLKISEIFYKIKRKQIITAFTIIWQNYMDKRKNVLTDIDTLWFLIKTEIYYKG